MIEIDETEYIYSGYCNVKKKTDEQENFCEIREQICAFFYGWA